MMNNITQVPSDELIADSYLIYGDYVNSFRAIPSIYDGLKPSYKRLIQTAYEKISKDYTKTADLLGQNMSAYHPHGSDSLKEVVSNLVHLGILDGQGNFGYKHLDGDVQESAAIRYTEVRLNKHIRDQFDKVAPYVPTIPSYNSQPEWLYVPTPIPFSLVTGALGIALGVGTRVPPFKMKSLLEAYRHDNPDLLELNYGYQLTDKVGIRNLWDKGEGRLSVKFPVEEKWEDQYGFLISGIPEIFTLPMTKLNEWMQQGLIFWRDESDDVPKMFVSRVKRTRKITDEELKDYLDTLTTKSVGYRIRVTYNKVVRNIGIKDWIDATYKNYINLINRYKDDNLQQLDIQQIMWTNFKDIAERLINKMPTDQVAKELNLSEDIVNMVGRKQINTLLTADPQKELLRIDSNRDYFKKINPEDMVTEFVEEGFNGVSMED